jgi:hypothetical protein
MNNTISHNWQDESPEAKARWFQSLSLKERMDMLCFFTDMILQNNPKLMELKNVKPASRRIRILTKSSG